MKINGRNRQSDTSRRQRREKTALWNNDVDLSSIAILLRICYLVEREKSTRTHLFSGVLSRRTNKRSESKKERKEALIAAHEGHRLRTLREACAATRTEKRRRRASQKGMRESPSVWKEKKRLRRYISEPSVISPCLLFHAERKRVCACVPL